MVSPWTMGSSVGGAFSMQHEGAVQRTVHVKGIEVAACYEQNAEQLIMPYWSPQPCSSKRTVVLGAFSRCSWVLTFSGWKWQWASPHFFAAAMCPHKMLFERLKGFCTTIINPVINHFWRWWTEIIPFLDGPLHRDMGNTNWHGVVCSLCKQFAPCFICISCSRFCNVSLRL